MLPNSKIWSGPGVANFWGWIFRSGFWSRVVLTVLEMPPFVRSILGGVWEVFLEGFSKVYWITTQTWREKPQQSPTLSSTGPPIAQGAMVSYRLVFVYTICYKWTAISADRPRDTKLLSYHGMMPMPKNFSGNRGDADVAFADGVCNPSADGRTDWRTDWRTTYTDHRRNFLSPDKSLQAVAFAAAVWAGVAQWNTTTPATAAGVES